MAEPQAAYCVFVDSFKHKVIYKFRKHLEKLGQAGDIKFLSTLTDGHFCNDMEKKLLSLPVKYGGMGTVIFVTSFKMNTTTQEP